MYKQTYVSNVTEHRKKVMKEPMNNSLSNTSATSRHSLTTFFASASAALASRLMSTYSSILLKHSSIFTSTWVCLPTSASSPGVLDWGAGRSDFQSGSIAGLSRPLMGVWLSFIHSNRFKTSTKI